MKLTVAQVKAGRTALKKSLYMRLGYDAVLIDAIQAMFPLALVEEDACPGHVASELHSKICGRCGIHIDSLR